MSYVYCPYGNRPELKELSRKLWKTEDNYPIQSFENLITRGFCTAEEQANWDEWIASLEEILSVPA